MQTRLPEAWGRACARHKAHPPPSTSTNPSLCRRSQRWATGAVLAGREDMSKALSLSLEDIRSSLIRQEDTIIFNFIERAQFCRNTPVYTPDAIPVPAFDKQGKRLSLLQFILKGTENLHASVRRYTSPDEHPFYPDDLPPLAIPPIIYSDILASYAPSININSDIMRVYLEEVLPGIAPEGDDNNYGSTSVLDVLCLQALSKRVHYGKFVAEAKFRAQPEEYTRLIRAGDAEGIMELLTDKAVERRVLDRVRLKTETFGQDILAPTGTAAANGTTNGDGPRFKVSPDAVAAVYEKWVMPLTKEVEVANSITTQNRCPLPNMTDLLDSLHGARVFSTLNFVSGHHQVCMHPDSIHKNALRAKYGS